MHLQNEYQLIKRSILEMQGFQQLTALLEISNNPVMEVIQFYQELKTQRMQVDSQILIYYDFNQSPKTRETINVSIRFKNSQADYAALIEEQNIFFKRQGKAYVIAPSSKMEPIYDSSAKLEYLLLSLNDQEIKIVAQTIRPIQCIYLALKRKIAHKGFNQYFKPLKRLGKGSFATVYLVEHKMTGEKLAAKVFSREGQKIGHMGQESLLNEIRLLKELNHPNIIRFQGLYQTQNLIYLVTQYLSGGTLADFMRNKSSLMGDFILKIISDCLTALNYLQSKCIMHRDFKPENIIMRQSDERWVLADFGLAAYSNEKYLFDKCGTVGYIAPEILDENSTVKSYNSSCDIYSLGVVAYNLIVGCLPFRMEGGMLDRKMVWDAFTKPESIGLDEVILDLLKGLLEKNPQKRLSPSDALRSSLFSDPKVIDSWKKFNQKRIQESYTRVLRIRNN